MRNILTFIIAILPFIGYFWGRRNGKQDLKNEQNKNVIKKVKATASRRNDRINDTSVDDLRSLQEWNTD